MTKDIQFEKKSPKLTRGDFKERKPGKLSKKVDNKGEVGGGGGSRISKIMWMSFVTGP